MSSGIRRAKPQPLEDKRRDRCRKWRIWATIGKGADGRNVRKAKIFNGSYSEAVKAMEELAEQYAKVSPDAPRGLTFAEAGNRWIDQQLAFGEITEATAGKKRAHIKTMRHALGDIELSSVTREALETAYFKLLNGDSPSGRKLTRTTLNGVAQTTNALLEHAAEAGMIAPLGKLRNFTPDTKARRALSNADARRLVSSLDFGDHHHVALALYLLAGLRRAEALSLTWGDLQEQDGPRGKVKTLHVHGTKSDAAQAVIPIADELAEFLGNWRQVQAFRFETEWLAHTDRTPIVSEYGETMKPAAMGKWWARNRDALGFPGLKLHELRHTFATLLAREGVPIVKTAALMRDKSTITVERIYTHMDMRDKIAAIDALNGAI